ncbi:MaoC family dehydratase [Halobacteriaceae archaeon GCM10025711]
MTEEKKSITTPPNPFASVADAWLQASEDLFNSAIRFNRAALGTYTAEDREEHEAPPIASISYKEPSWSFERTVEDAESIGVGDSVRFTKVIDDDDVRSFAEASGDTNRLHLDDEFAVDTRFGNRIVHGTLVSGLISAALARLPGLTIYLSQDVRFLKPVDIGDELTAVVEVVEDIGDAQYRLSTNVYDGDDETVIEGEAVVLVDDLPGEEAGARA